MSNQPEEKNNNRIFPRNLTANAAFLVKGNPMNSRPEDSVENCYPGLEFDQRNIDKVFFPGLVFEFHREFQFDGISEPALKYIQPLLRVVNKNDLITSEDVNYTGKDDDLKLFIWRLAVPGSGLDLDTGRFTDPNTDSGLSVWKYVREIPSNADIKILVATPASKNDPEIYTEAIAAFNSGDAQQAKRLEDGSLLWAVLTSKRTAMVDSESGLLDTENIEPGDLTRSLCNPWQYDFRDCKCYYWAANKPDIVTNHFGTDEFLDFLRKDRNHYPDVPVGTEAEWLGQEFTHVDLISNWQQLPVVIDDKEVNYSIILITETLQNLAPVEHALCVEYLYAYYSIDIEKADIKPAADEVLRIAIDEMRHFRWVNEMLSLLHAKPVVDRAKDYGTAFNDRPFSLNLMTKDTLDWFISVEKPSQSINVPGQIDGMYVQLHDKIMENRWDIPQADKLCEIIKLIIDEGDGHYHRYLFIEKALDKYWKKGESILYTGAQAKVEPDDIYSEISNLAYLLLLSGLQISFSLGEASNGKVMQFAIRSMHLMDKYNRLLSKSGKMPSFDMPPLEIFESPELIDIISKVEAKIKRLSEKIKALAPEINQTKGTPFAKNMLDAELKSAAAETVDLQLETIAGIKNELESLKPVKNIPGGTKPSS